MPIKGIIRRGILPKFISGAAPSNATLDTGNIVTWTGNGAGTYNQSITIAANSNRIVIVCIASRGSAGPSAVTFDGVGMTLFSSETTNSTSQSYVYYTIAPGTGSKTISITLSGALHSMCATGFSCYNVNQATGLNNATTTSGGAGTTTLSRTVTSATGSLCLSTVAAGGVTDDTFSVGAGETKRSDQIDTAVQGATASEAGAASVAMSFTWTTGGTASMIGFNVIQV